MKELELNFEVQGIGHKIKVNGFTWNELTNENIIRCVNNFLKNNRVDLYLIRMMFDYHTAYCLNALKVQYKEYIQLVSITPL